MLKHKKLIAVLVCIAAGLIYIFLSTIRLYSQGLYYDELFQATSSFAYIGQPPFQFSVLQIRGLPVMNLNYVGAIKTAIYGLYLRFSGQTFGVISWRLVGIICTGLGLFLFGMIARKRLSLLGLLVFFFLVITDLTVMLTTRFDWGPVALALFLRLIFIAVWLNGELSNHIQARNSFWLGALFGISVFEKLSADVLVIPLLLMVLLSSRRRNIRHIGAITSGGIIGLSPLILANLYTFYKWGYFISFHLQSIIYQKHYSFYDLFVYVKEYLSLGAGEWVRSFILGGIQHPFSLVEIALLLSLLIFVIIILIVNVRLASNYFRLSGIMLLSYFSIMVSLYFLPVPTWVHHWVIGTPFQYAAIALFISGLIENNSITKVNLYKGITAILFCLIIVSRLSGLLSLEQSFLRGDASAKWDPSLTTIGEFAASQSDRSLFIAGDWGTANQMICYLNGKPGVVYEIYVQDRSNIDQIIDIIRNSQKPDVYLVFHNPPYFANPEARTLLLTNINRTLGSVWIEQPIDAQVEGLKSVIVYKFSKESP